MLAGFLLALMIKATLVLLATWTVARLMARASAAARSSVWAWGLAFALMLPGFMAAAPAWSLDALPWAPARIGSGAVVSDPAPDEPIAAAGSQSIPQMAIVPTAARTAAAMLSEWSSPLALTFAVIWALGTILMLVRFGRGLVSVLHIARDAEPLQDAEWTATVADCCRQLGLRRAPPILISSSVGVPAVSGVLKPTLLLPSWCREWSPSCRRVVVLHELAHVRRRDCLIQLLADAACALYWFHPLVHRAAAWLRDERERSSDDIVLEAGTCATTYADHLLDVVRVGVGLPPAPAVAFGTPSRLSQRIAAILDDRQPRKAPRTLMLGAAVLAASGAMAFLGGVRVIAQSNTIGHPADHGLNVVSRVITAETRQRVADALAVALRDADSSVRDVATRAVASIQASGEASVRIEAICGGNCVNWPDVAAQTPAGDAIDLLAHDDVEIRREAAAKVWARSERGAAALARALVDTDQIVRNLAAVRLDSVHAPVAVPNWIALLADADPMLRERAAISLGVIGDPRAIDPLAHVLRDPEVSVRLQAASGLAAIALGTELFYQHSGASVDMPTATTATGRAADRPIYSPGNGVTIPELITKVRPEYTEAAKAAGIVGSVVVEAVVEPDGSVGEVWVVRSLDEQHGLDAQATMAARQYEFKPGLRDGKPVAVAVSLQFNFTLR
jgi:TonB family protein